jgi:hypothetical protein
MTSVVGTMAQTVAMQQVYDQPIISVKQAVF